MTLNAHKVIDKAAEFYDVPVEEIKDPSRRDPHVIAARRACSIILRIECRFSWASIDQWFGYCNAHPGRNSHRLYHNATDRQWDESLQIFYALGGNRGRANAA